MSNNYCVIMAGGIGSRFWPMSRTSHPKQFIDILGTGETLIQQTFKRFEKIIPKENIFIVTNDKYADLVSEQIPSLDVRQIISEPARRNTAPCIAYACYKINETDPNANVVIAPSDHIILNEDSFSGIICSALQAASKNNWLLTLGITPSRPDTGYGYIQYKDTDGYPEDTRLKKVKTFTEKPVLEMARQFIESGDFLWNSGIFVWSIKSILQAFEIHLPEIKESFDKGKGIYNTDKEWEFIQHTYSTGKSISIDYGVMEKADNVYVLCSDFGWSDLGTWGSLYENRKKNEAGNAIVGKDVIMYDSHNCIVNMPENKLVVLQGLDDYIVVESGNVLLICRKNDEQQIRNFVNDVKIKIEKGEQYI
ncbi:MAG TPA: mannose-1-phosphate guanylyltransferase [Bacteroidales bacterium]|nr:mannose-1-phosphate guanylyltransferase [Bacteroidales bacterium]HQI70781.1 mannose-1-phosphate guanylyltransferase [Bacteroidales bacterium]